MRLALGPLQYFWPRERVLAFYGAAADWPLDAVYVGETVCGKRRALGPRDWIALAAELAAPGREVVLSSLALIEAESELATLTRLVENGRFLVEANDMAAVQLLRERRLPFVAGPTLNLYNHAAVRLLREDGMKRLVLGVEHGRDWLMELLASGTSLPELEIAAWGRLPLAHSARCFTARALDLAKDECGLRCGEFPEGLPLATRDGAPFLTLNGVEVQSGACVDLAPELDELRAAGIGWLRLYPQAEGMSDVVARFRAACDTGIAPPRAGAANGWWSGAAGRPHAG